VLNESGVSTCQVVDCAELACETCLLGTIKIEVHNLKLSANSLLQFFSSQTKYINAKEFMLIYSHIGAACRMIC
jgi:hypothetical protein